MRKLIVGIILTLISYQAAAYEISREQFVEKLTIESCHGSPESIFIDTSHTNFDLAHAYSFSWIALQTLDTDSQTFDDDADADLVKAEQQWGIKNVRMIENKRWNVKVMISTYGDDVFLTFRHTDSNLNWLLNADYGLWDFSHSFTLGAPVHHGFGTMLGSVWNDILQQLNRTPYQNKRIHIFGHSLGGALALLAAPGLQVEGFDLAQVYATGAPKVAGRNWQELAKQQLVNVPVYRITNTHDLFAKIPVSNLALDEFRELFSFIPDFLANAIGGLRSQMEYGVIGDEALMTPNLSLNYETSLTSELSEQNYWLDIADQFRTIDESSNNIVDNLKKKADVISSNLSVHLMRKPTDGYTCSMIKLLKMN
ncbi:MAG: hypothetical protein HWE27_06090 [Gammaproteobacteria bacterium]|nr:hypothetical protein [Gammaproteobacteria bacterium]